MARPRNRSKSFYAQAMNEAEQAAYEEAIDITDLTQEAAILRVRLMQALRDCPDDQELIREGIQQLIRTLLANHRISGKQAADLSEAAIGLIESMTLELTRE